MATVTERENQVFGPRSAGTRMTPREFDRAEFLEGWRYELINGVLVVTPMALINERDPNEMLGHWLYAYQIGHPQGSALDLTTYEHTLRTGKNRRRADRVIWAGLGRLPGARDVPAIVVEYVGAGKRNRKRDYEEKRDEYMAIKVQEYWVVDRFQRTLTVFSRQGNRIKRQVITEKQSYSTPLLPGFELPLAELLKIADRWPEGWDEE
jgi:Uma2 family endonuclease